LKLFLDLSAELRPLLEAGLPGLLPPAKELLRFGDFNFFFQKHKVITIIIILQWATLIGLSQKNSNALKVPK
jgi:hypothetical protein